MQKNAAAAPPMASRAFAKLTLDPHTLADFEETDISPPGLFDYYNRHKTLLTLFDQEPDTAVDSFVAPSAALIGRVTIQDRSTVGYGCVLRADTNYIHVGAYSHIMDGTSVQVKLDTNGAPGGTVSLRSAMTRAACTRCSHFRICIGYWGEKNHSRPIHAAVTRAVRIAGGRLLQ